MKAHHSLDTLSSKELIRSGIPIKVVFDAQRSCFLLYPAFSLLDGEIF
jgi:hypothetical protein